MTHVTDTANMRSCIGLLSQFLGRNVAFRRKIGATRFCKIRLLGQKIFKILKSHFLT
jgi:hypothetical protein